jgi:integrase
VNIFKSKFADKITTFIEYKQRLGYDYNDVAFHLRGFDNFCYLHFPNEQYLTKELCAAWIQCLSPQKNNSYRSKISSIREFAKFLNLNNEESFIIPIDDIKRDNKPTPYIYSESDISKIWSAFDNMKVDSRSPVRHLVFPSVIRLLYCCGLRPNEPRMLKVENVDLNIGKIYIQESKNHKDRKVMLADDFCEYLRKYDESVKKIFPKRIWFFPKSATTVYSRIKLYNFYTKIKKDLKLTSYGYYNPRLYDFRHTFATHRLYKCLKDNEDVNFFLPYLSTYMGHSNLNDTYYYVSFIPELFERMSGHDFSVYENLIPGVLENE